MNIEPCQIEDEAASAKGFGEPREETPEHNQIEKAHLHDSVGDVVHSHREGAKWSDLFTNIKYPMDYSIENKSENCGE